jgi:hypothetical protein
MVSRQNCRSRMLPATCSATAYTDMDLVLEQLMPWADAMNGVWNQTRQASHPSGNWITCRYISVLC